MARISSIRCPLCNNFAWGSHMEPVALDGRWHHPACPAVRAHEQAGAYSVPPSLQGTKYGIPGDSSTWQEKPWVPDPKYLKKQVSLDHLRIEQGKSGEAFDVRLAEMALRHRPGDEVWFWDDMFDLAGMRAYLLIRNGKVIYSLVLAVS